METTKAPLTRPCPACAAPTTLVPDWDGRNHTWTHDTNGSTRCVLPDGGVMGADRHDYLVELHGRGVVQTDRGTVRLPLDAQQADGETCIVCGIRGGPTFDVGKVRSIGGSFVAYARAHMPAQSFDRCEITETVK